MIVVMRYIRTMIDIIEAYDNARVLNWSHRLPHPLLLTHSGIRLGEGNYFEAGYHSPTISPIETMIKPWAKQNSICHLSL